MTQCRYGLAGCTAPETHYCAECGSFYCAEHASRHDRLVLENFAPFHPGGVDPQYAILAKPISPQPGADAQAARN